MIILSRGGVTADSAGLWYHLHRSYLCWGVIKDMRQSLISNEDSLKSDPSCTSEDEPCLWIRILAISAFCTIRCLHASASPRTTIILIKEKTSYQNFLIMFLDKRKMFVKFDAFFLKKTCSFWKQWDFYTINLHPLALQQYTCCIPDSHWICYLNQCWLFVTWNFTDTGQLNLKQSKNNNLFHNNLVEQYVCTM